MRRASDTTVPDTTSGFRAYNREAALQVQVVSRFTYTLETIIQAGKMLVAIDHVPIRTNPKMRESRLFRSISSYVRTNAVAIFRIYTHVRAAAGVPRRRGRRGARARSWSGAASSSSSSRATAPGHVQSVVLGAMLFVVAVQLAALGVIGDLLAANRVLIQRTLERDAADRAEARRRALALRARRATARPQRPSCRRAADDDDAAATRRAASAARAPSGDTEEHALPLGGRS